MANSFATGNPDFPPRLVVFAQRVSLVFFIFVLFILYNNINVVRILFAPRVITVGSGRGGGILKRVLRSFTRSRGPRKNYRPARLRCAETP